MERKEITSHEFRFDCCLVEAMVIVLMGGTESSMVNIHSGLGGNAQVPLLE